MPRDITFFIFPQFQLLDLSGPLAAFQIASETTRNAYFLRVVAEQPGGIVSSSGVSVIAQPFVRTSLDTLIVVGGRGVHACAEAKCTRRLIARSAARARRTASVCTGAFLLASAGLLDGRRATTHWRSLGWMRESFPAVTVETELHVVEDGNVLTSAGISAGIDMALLIVARHHGEEVARATARHMEYPYPDDLRRRI